MKNLKLFIVFFLALVCTIGYSEMGSLNNNATMATVTSIESKVDVVDGLHDVPTQNSAANTTMRDVIGNKTDGHTGNSLYSRIKTLLEHIHNPSKVYPTLANGVQVSGGAAWTLGNFTEIVPASTITSDFDIHHVSIENISANDVYELVLYSCAAQTESGRVRFTKNAVQDGTMNIPMQTSLIAANCKIEAKIASSSGSDNATISIFYHTY